MRTLKRVALVMLVVLAVSATGWGATLVKASKTLIAGSPHDLTSGFSVFAYEVCDFCHIAHKPGAIGSTVGPGYLLWNHTISSVTSYGVYSSETFNGLNPTISDLGANNANSSTSPLTSSNLCLSCHDGTVAINSFFVQPSGTSTATQYFFPYMTSGLLIEDLTKTHPVHFVYNSTLASAAGVLSPANANSVDGAGSIPLFNGYMECSTCHDPHNWQVIAGRYSPFLQKLLASYSGTGEFCNYCHI